MIGYRVQRLSSVGWEPYRSGEEDGRTPVSSPTYGSTANAYFPDSMRAQAVATADFLAEKYGRPHRVIVGETGEAVYQTDQRWLTAGPYLGQAPSSTSVWNGIGWYEP